MDECFATSHPPRHFRDGGEGVNVLGIGRLERNDARNDCFAAIKPDMYFRCGGAGGGTSCNSVG